MSSPRCKVDLSQLMSPDVFSALMSCIKESNIKELKSLVGFSHSSDASGNNEDVVSSSNDDALSPKEKVRQINEAIAEAIDGFFMIFDCRGNLDYVSGKIEKYLSIEPKKLHEQSVFDIVHENDRTNFENVCKSLSAVKKARYQRSFSCRLLWNEGPNNGIPQQRFRTMICICFAVKRYYSSAKSGFRILTVLCHLSLDRHVWAMQQEDFSDTIGHFSVVFDPNWIILRASVSTNSHSRFPAIKEQCNLKEIFLPTDKDIFYRHLKQSSQNGCDVSAIVRIKGADSQIYEAQAKTQFFMQGPSRCYLSHFKVILNRNSSMNSHSNQPPLSILDLDTHASSLQIAENYGKPDTPPKPYTHDVNIFTSFNDFANDDQRPTSPINNTSSQLNKHQNLSLTTDTPYPYSDSSPGFQTNSFEMNKSITVSPLESPTSTTDPENSSLANSTNNTPVLIADKIRRTSGFSVRQDFESREKAALNFADGVRFRQEKLRKILHETLLSRANSMHDRILPDSNTNPISDALTTKSRKSFIKQILTCTFVDHKKLGPINEPESPTQIGNRENELSNSSSGKNAILNHLLTSNSDVFWLQDKNKEENGMLSPKLKEEPEEEKPFLNSCSKKDNFVHDLLDKYNEIKKKKTSPLLSKRLPETNDIDCKLNVKKDDAITSSQNPRKRRKRSDKSRHISADSTVSPPINVSLIQPQTESSTSVVSSMADSVDSELSSSDKFDISDSMFDQLFSTSDSADVFMKMMLDQDVNDQPPVDRNTSDFTNFERLSSTPSLHFDSGEDTSPASLSISLPPEGNSSEVVTLPSHTESVFCQTETTDSFKQPAAISRSQSNGPRSAHTNARLKQMLDSRQMTLQKKTSKTLSPTKHQLAVSIPKQDLSDFQIPVDDLYIDPSIAPKEEKMDTNNSRNLLENMKVSYSPQTMSVPMSPMANQIVSPNYVRSGPHAQATDHDPSFAEMYFNGGVCNQNGFPQQNNCSSMSSNTIYSNQVLELPPNQSALNIPDQINSDALHQMFKCKSSVSCPSPYPSGLQQLEAAMSRPKMYSPQCDNSVLQMQPIETMPPQNQRFVQPQTVPMRYIKDSSPTMLGEHHMKQPRFSRPYQMQPYHNVGYMHMYNQPNLVPNNTSNHSIHQLLSNTIAPNANRMSVAQPSPNSQGINQSFMANSLRPSALSRSTSVPSAVNIAMSHGTMNHDANNVNSFPKYSQVNEPSKPLINDLQEPMRTNISSNFDPQTVELWDYIDDDLLSQILENPSSELCPEKNSSHSSQNTSHSVFDPSAIQNNMPQMKMEDSSFLATNCFMSQVNKTPTHSVATSGMLPFTRSESPQNESNNSMLLARLLSDFDNSHA